VSNPLSKKIEHAADNRQDVSAREFLTKIYIRPRLFWSCVIIPVLFALLFTALVPTTWKASVKIMLRYSTSESAFLKDLIPAERAVLSGASSAEILKGIPTLVNTIREQNIKDEDIYKKPHEVLGGYVGSALENFFPSSLPPGLPGIDPKTLLLAKSFKDSLEEKSSGSSKIKPVEVLEKSSQMPAGLKGDELITVVVQSFNREKVAQMANGLASAFIDEYYRVSADDAHRAYVYLSDLAAKAEKELHALETAKAGANTSSLLSVVSGGPEDIARNSPVLSSMSSELVSLQNALVKAQEVYAPNSDPIRQLQAQLVQARRNIARQENIEIAKHVLAQIKQRRFQALNTENLYKNRLVPISVVEPAFTPKKSFSKVAMRFVIAGCVGLVLGLMLAFGLIVVLDVTDPCLYTSWQVRKRLGLPILSALPDLGKTASSQTLQAAQDASPPMVNGLLQIVGKMGRFAEGKKAGAHVIVLASASKGEGKTFLSLALGGALGQGRRHKVLLIDANLRDADMSRLLGLAEQPGYVDAMMDDQGAESRIAKDRYRGCDLLPAGSIGKVGELGFYAEELASNIEAMKALYDFIIIDTAPLMSSNEALICGLAADSVLIVVSAGHTRKSLVDGALQKLNEVGVSPEGVVLNRKREFLPAFIYRNV
jgi:Mrp family chromosome partitioning ATPase/uncharacterized protein involved in exopolysaccharide biosynthesis